MALVLDGNGTMTVGNGSISGLNAGGLPDASVTQADLAAGVAGNGPSFSAYLASSGGSVTSTTFTKLTFSTELWDTNNIFASSRFTPTVAGYYQINSAYQVSPAVSGFITIYKTGSEYKRGSWISSGTRLDMAVSGLVYCNGTSDYVEIYIYQTTGTVTPQGGQFISWFDGCLVRAE
jgi:hypothetical protein